MIIMATPRGKLKIIAIETPRDDRATVTFTFSRSLTDLEIQGLTTIVRQAIAQ